MKLTHIGLTSILSLGLIACGGGSSSGGSNTPGGTGGEGGEGGTGGEGGAPRLTININSNNSVVSYRLRNILDAASKGGNSGDIIEYSISAPNGDLDPSMVYMHDDQQGVIKIQSSLANEMGSVDVDLKYENKSRIDEDTGLNEVQIMNLTLNFVNDGVKSGNYQYTLNGEGQAKVGVDLNGYGALNNQSTNPYENDSLKGQFPVNFRDGFNVSTVHSACDDMLSSGVFVAPNDDDRFTCFFFKDATPKSFDGEINFIDDVVSIHFTQEESETAAIYINPLANTVSYSALDNDYYLITPSNVSTGGSAKELYTLIGEDIDSNVLLTGETRKLNTVFGNMGLLVRSMNQVKLFNPITNMFVDVEMPVSENSVVTWIPQNNTSYKFYLMETLEDGSNKMWSVDKTLVGSIELDNVGNIAGDSDNKSMIKTENVLYTVSQNDDSKYVLNGNGVTLSSAYVSESNNGIIHNKFQDGVYFPVISEGVESVYKVDNMLLSVLPSDPISSLHNIVESTIYVPGVGLNPGGFVTQKIVDEIMSFSNINYMDGQYYFDDLNNLNLVLHEVVDAETVPVHEEVFNIELANNNSLLKNITRNLQKYQASNGTVEGVLFNIKDVAYLGGLVFTLNDNGENKMKTDYTDQSALGVYSIVNIMGTTNNIISQTGSDFKKMCEESNGLYEGAALGNQSDFSDLTLIGETIYYVDNGSVKSKSIENEVCK